MVSRGDAQVCPAQQQPGFTHWGSFAEHVALHAADTNLVAIPDEVDFADGGQPRMPVRHGLPRPGRPRAGHGRASGSPSSAAGGVGLSVVMIARALGARVVAVDRNPEALAVATALGAEHTLLADGSDIPAAVAELTDGGSHVAVDAVGSEQTCADSILSLRRRGRQVQVGLLPPVAGHPRVPMARVIAWELDLLGSHGMAATDYPGMMQLIQQGLLQPQRLVERTIGLDEAAALLPRFDHSPVAGMTIVDPSR